ncbi:Calpain [Echinococcus granulosus]|uniref:Calpain n=1 Tax=Echinococcus granulosus TaxID=6210 RepID=W6UGM0_ECHGR|nr:Calpain [Echinococcus granulosus]EUB60655.1 Calpain [Echinococcus granulosus]
MPVKIVYDPDDSAGRVPNKNIKHRSLVNGKVINVKMGTPDDYKKVLQTKSSTQRLSVNPDVPKTLTPKGYTKEINPRADFIVAGADRGDVVQGQLGDCWLLAVISSMADITELFNHIVPKGQTIQGPDYVGVFKFRFWRFGQWVEVLVDDRLPVVAGTNEMIFMHSDECNEFWSPLMEKAYAKLNGCYANLSGGTQGEAMEDMTGGLVESLDLKKVPGPEFYSDVHKYLKRCCLMGCSITSKEIEAKLNNGLIAGHAYSVNDLEDVTYKGSKVHLLRVRNPWGNNYEWKGDWSDNAPQWRDVSEADKTRLHLRFAADGEFWMSMDDFMKCFTKLEVCHLGHESLEEGMTVKGKKRLEETFFSGEWVKNVNAGGCANFRDPTDDQDKSTVVIGLMQKNVRKRGGGNFFTIGFCVYKVSHVTKSMRFFLSVMRGRGGLRNALLFYPFGQIPSNTEGLLKRDFFNTNRPISISEFTNTREVVVKLRVMPGCYLIVPSTFNPNQEAQFIIRVFTETIIKESECDDKNSFKGLSENEDDFVDSLFNSAKDPVTNSINAEQLRDILNKSTMKCKMEYDEFKRLWENCQCWRVSSVATVMCLNLTEAQERSHICDLCLKDVFAQRDRDASKTLNVTELREALMSAGFHLSGLVFTVVVQRFVTQKLNAVTFEDWLICCVRLKNSFETMKAQFKTNDGNLMFTEDDVAGRKPELD